MQKLAAKVSTVKCFKGGGSKAGHRVVKCEARALAMRSYNRAARKAARQECNAARFGE